MNLQIYNEKIYLWDGDKAVDVAFPVQEQFTGITDDFINRTYTKTNMFLYLESCFPGCDDAEYNRCADEMMRIPNMVNRFKSTTRRPLSEFDHYFKSEDDNYIQEFTEIVKNYEIMMEQDQPAEQSQPEEQKEEQNNQEQKQQDQQEQKQQEQPQPQQQPAQNQQPANNTPGNQTQTSDVDPRVIIPPEELRTYKGTSSIIAKINSMNLPVKDPETGYTRREILDATINEWKNKYDPTAKTDGKIPLDRRSQGLNDPSNLPAYQFIATTILRAYTSNAYAHDFSEKLDAAVRVPVYSIRPETLTAINNATFHQNPDRNKEIRQNIIDSFFYAQKEVFMLRAKNAIYKQGKKEMRANNGKKRFVFDVLRGKDYGNETYSCIFRFLPSNDDEIKSHMVILLHCANVGTKEEYIKKFSPASDFLFKDGSFISMIQMADKCAKQLLPEDLNNPPPISKEDYRYTGNTTAEYFVSHGLIDKTIPISKNSI